MSAVTIQMTVNEGYSDQRGPNRVSVYIEGALDGVPRKGDSFDTGAGEIEVRSVLWMFGGEPALLTLGDYFTTSEPFDDVMARLRKAGWR